MVRTLVVRCGQARLEAAKVVRAEQRLSGAVHGERHRAAGGNARRIARLKTSGTGPSCMHIAITFPHGIANGVKAKRCLRPHRAPPYRGAVRH